MLETIDLNILDSTKRFFDLKDYELDGNLSYCDISKLKPFLSNIQLIIDKVIRARINSNWKILNLFSNYREDSLTRAAAVNFYYLRDTFSLLYYYLTELKSQQIYYMPDISLIPEAIHIDDSKWSKKIADLKDLYSKDNADNDMLFDKITLVFQKYFKIAHIIMNDAEAITYSYSLLSAAGSIRDKYFYDFIKNVSFLYSTFIVFDRLNQLKEAIDFYERDRALFLTRTQKIDLNSWISEPRRSNVLIVKNILNERMQSSDYHRFLLLMDRHTDYIDRVKNLNPDE